MSIHLPLSLKSQAESKVLLISTNNWISTATGETNISPSQDMILGYYFLTTENNNLENLLSKILKINKTIKEYILNVKDFNKFYTKLSQKTKHLFKKIF